MSESRVGVFERVLKAKQKRDIADKMLVWLKDSDFASWLDATNMIHQVAKAIDEEPYDVWKAYDILRSVRRIELRSPNGRKGGYVADFTPLAKTVEVRATLCNAASCPILKSIREVFPDAK
ncbi:hypothetical protein LCGC14_0509990 [marine sediment metagenome]|uniref:Uncharacterized protein n=1 Tax=marine sediment metagenome TaxID=412755 RepID=A0A0F9V9S2_9ZZZZ